MQIPSFLSLVQNLWMHALSSLTNYKRAIWRMHGLSCLVNLHHWHCNKAVWSKSKAEVEQLKWKSNLLHYVRPGNTKGVSITVPLTSCLTDLDSVLQKKLSVVIQLIPNQSNRWSTVHWYFPL